MSTTADGKMKKSPVPGKKAGPNGSFPIGDKEHARLAIAGATRSEEVGNISKGTEEKIKSEARAKLGERGGKAKPSKKGKGKRKPYVPREFNAGARTSGGRSWGQFQQGSQVPGMGAQDAGPDQAPDDEAPPDIGA